MSNKVSLVVTYDNSDYNYIDRRIRHESVKHSAGKYVPRVGCHCPKQAMPLSYTCQEIPLADMACPGNSESVGQ